MSIGTKRPTVGIIQESARERSDNNNPIDYDNSRKHHRFPSQCSRTARSVGFIQTNFGKNTQRYRLSMESRDTHSNWRYVELMEPHSHSPILPESLVALLWVHLWMSNARSSDCGNAFVSTCGSIYGSDMGAQNPYISGPIHDTLSKLFIWSYKRCQ